VTVLVEFTVPGVAQPAGSKKAFQNRHTGRVVVVDDAKHSRPWKTTVAMVAAEAMAGRPVFDMPLALLLVLYMPRPKGHMGARGLRPSAPVFPAVKPDATKLLRACEDAMTGIVWRDDAQVVTQLVMKRYADHTHPCAEVRVWDAERVSGFFTVTEEERAA
jgi:Holliday junction resolvase RusA-like endonuclease